MDKLSEYIPIIIIIVSVVFSIFGKKKKSDKVTQETALPRRTAGEYIEYEELPRTVSGSNRRGIKEKAKMPAYNRAEIAKQKENIPAFSSKSVNLEPEEEAVFSFEGEEDVIQAIIYSEIINRKEY